MGMLFSSMWDRLKGGPKQHKIVIIGNANAGKTTTLYKLVLDEAIDTAPTLGSNVEELVYKNIKFVMWDLGGQESLRKTWASYYTSSEAIILVVDSTDRERMHLNREELYSILNSEELRSACILIFANKQDVADALSVSEISRELNLASIKTHPYHIQPCCALSGDGLLEGLDWITANMASG
ncbi:Arl5-family small GTPase [Thecamonas trahens ATCC 50062]|uniref:Arl5-family small GTPase n=1 Tax=Thecamonas trahens ATCC 50062 TaxID=461836 RepID=A0A0L0D8E1_THETB|nr:Arl5-family small GTPase [Thecamonas trahens ATCC 50062]KNC48632.1 Arl5-family small GTPase [Thecamonas trahens ATCC 50062]|eukprot:XP_013762688.1 Arl5-family small GTPase [Thecamonas trahens ATCC 50062]